MVKGDKIPLIIKTSFQKMMAWKTKIGGYKK
jgi:hypothetical protein